MHALSGTPTSRLRSNRRKRRPIALATIRQLERRYKAAAAHARARNERIDAASSVDRQHACSGSRPKASVARRLASHVRVPVPDEEQRELLWRAMIPAAAACTDDLDLREIARAQRQS